MSKKSITPPVFYTIAQAQFNPITAMANYIDKIQDKFRLDGYTRFEAQKIPQLQFNPSAQGKAEVVELPIWRITLSDRKSGFILTQSSLIYHTTHYQTHHQLFVNFLSGLQIVDSTLKLDHLSRLGLRYLNAILPNTGENIDEYLIKEVHGIHLNATRQYSLHESVFNIKFESISSPSTLVSRIYYLSGPLRYPPDIAPHDLITMPQFDNGSSSLHAIIDIDHFVEEQMLLDSEKVQKLLVSLHNKSKELLKATSTKHAITKWGI